MAISTVPTIAYYIHRTSLCFAKVVQVAIVRLAESARTILARPTAQYTPAAVGGVWRMYVNTLAIHLLVHSC
jgi:hypothetical protein